MTLHITGAAYQEPTAALSRFELDFAGLGRAIDEVLLAAAGSVYWLVFAAGEKGFPPFDAHLSEAIDRFGSPPHAALDLWRQCAALDRLSRRWMGRGLDVPAFADVAAAVRRARDASGADASRAAEAPPVAPIDEPVGPDEAVPVVPGPEAGPAEQPRLGGV